MIKISKKLISTIATVALSATLSTNSIAQADFAGKTVSLVVPGDEGSGGHRFGLLFAPFLEKYLPGEPTVLVVPRPGGSGAIAGSWFQRSAGNEGLNLIVSSTSMITNAMFKPHAVHFDMSDWQPVLLSPLGTCVLVNKDTGATGIDPIADASALQNEKQRYGAKTATSSDIRALLALDMLGLLDNTQVIFGQESGAAMQGLARGEFTINVSNTSSCLKSVAQFDNIDILMSFGYFDNNGTLQRDPSLPNNYTILEAYKANNNGADPSGENWNMMKHFINIAVMASKGIFLHPDTPQDIRDTYNEAVAKMLTDPEFISRAKKEIGDYPIATGNDAKRIIDGALQIHPSSMDWMRTWMTKEFEVKF